MATSNLHDQLLRALINHLSTRQNLTLIAADLEGFPLKPEKQGKHAPDAVLKDPGGVIHLVEAKIAEDLESERTAEQLNEFSNRIMSRTMAPVTLHLIVPRTAELRLKSRLMQLKLGNKIGSRIKIWTM